jgi:hypothetical protein
MCDFNCEVEKPTEEEACSLGVDLHLGKLSYDGVPPTPKEFINWLQLRRWTCSPIALKNWFDQLVNQYPEAL